MRFKPSYLLNGGKSEKKVRKKRGGDKIKMIEKEKITEIQKMVALLSPKRSDKIIAPDIRQMHYLVNTCLNKSQIGVWWASGPCSSLPPS